MGKQQDGFNGSFSGRLGNVVGYNWRGKWCVRSLPTDFHDARTDGQLRQRRLFAEMVRFASKASRILKISLDVVARNEGVTTSNRFVGMNKDCFALQDGELTVDLPSLRISDGPVAPVAFDMPQLVDDTTISIVFEKNPLHRNCSQDDKVYLVVYCPEYKSFDFSDAILRRNRRVVMQLNEAWAGKEVHLWGFVVDNAGRASQSIYIGSGVLDFDENKDENETDGGDNLFEEEIAAACNQELEEKKADVANGTPARTIIAAPPGGR